MRWKIDASDSWHRTRRRIVVIKVATIIPIVRMVTRALIIETCSAHRQNWETVDLSEAINLSGGTRPDDSILRLEIPTVS